MASVFVSYASEDQVVARKIAEALKNLGHEVWFAEWKIRVGDSIPSGISSGLSAANFLVLLLSKNSVESEWVKKEWNEKVSEESRDGRPRVLPVILEDCSIPYLLKSRRLADFRVDFSVGLAQLSESLVHLEPSQENQFHRIGQGSTLVYSDRIPAVAPSFYGAPKLIGPSNRKFVSKSQAEKLRESSELLAGFSREIAKASSSGDTARMRRLYLSQIEQATAVNDGIIEYIRIYLDGRPKGVGVRFKIRFTDSRALFGSERLLEWLNRSDYLTSLLSLTKDAAGHFQGEHLISRAFIVKSFTQLLLDNQLRFVLLEVMRQHLKIGVNVSVVSLRLLDDLGFDAVNFCIFEGGHLMKLNIGVENGFSIHDERAAYRFNELHDELTRWRSGTVSFSSISQLESSFGEAVVEQVRNEGFSKKLVLTSDTKEQAEQYDKTVAEWWSDPEWESERRLEELPRISRWCSRFGIPESAAVLDVACGTGLHSFLLAELGYTVTGCDASWFQVERARMIAAIRRITDNQLAPQNPFFRTLEWSELSQHYNKVFSAAFCLGGSLIHASASDLSAVAQSFKSVIKPHGLLLVDHRNPEFFRDPKNRSSSHAGHSRDVEFDFETNDIVFKMTDDSGNVNRIKGVLHPPKYLIDEFLRAGFSIADIEYDFGSRESDGSEWIHFTFIAN